MTLTGKAKVAVLVANGFNEKHFLTVQKFLTEMDACVRIISMNQGLVNGWNEEENNWGHNYAVDTQLNSALGVDFDAVIIPGGKRSLDKMKMTAHTRRFIGSFMSGHKPVAVMDDAMDIMMHTQASDGYKFADAGQPAMMDRHMLTGMVDDAYMEMMHDLFSHMDMDQAA